MNKKNWISALLVVVCALFSSFSNAVEIKASNAAVKQFSAAYGFALGQQITLDTIKEKYPDLKRDALLVELQFSNQFKSSIEAIDSYMLGFMGQKWTDMKPQMKAKMLEMFNPSNITRTEAVAFLEEVSNRAEGDFPEDTLATYLMFNPRYQKNPALELSEGWSYKYESNGSGKAKGVRFSFKVPYSWGQKEADRPNIVQKFISQNGRGPEMMMVMVNETGLKPHEYLDEAEIDEMLLPQNVKDFVPAGGKLTGKGKLTMSSYPGMWLQYEIPVQIGRSTAMTHGIMYMIYPRDKFVALMGQTVMEVNGQKTDTDGLEYYEQLFDLMVNSFVMPDAYSY